MAALAPRPPADGAAPAAPPAPASAWAALFGAWEDVVGPALARHVTPHRLDGELLVVAVDRPPWATQVKALGPQILARVAEVTGAHPSRIEIVIRPR